MAIKIHTIINARWMELF